MRYAQVDMHDNLAAEVVDRSNYQGEVVDPEEA